MELYEKDFETLPFIDEIDGTEKWLVVYEGDFPTRKEAQSFIKSMILKMLRT